MTEYEYDSNGRIILEERGNFKEITTYYDDGSKRVETHYPQGQVEVENFVS